MSRKYISKFNYACPILFSTQNNNKCNIIISSRQHHISVLLYKLQYIEKPIIHISMVLLVR